MAKTKSTAEEEIFNDDFEFDAGSEPAPKDQINNGELVRCIILDVGHTAAHIKDVEEYNKNAQEQAENLGIEPELRSLSFKEGGVCAKVAVITKLDTGQQVFSMKEDASGAVYTEPSYTCYTQITMPSPLTIYEKGWGSFSKGLMNINHEGRIYINNFIPSAFPVQNWDTKEIIVDKDEERKEMVKSLLDRYKEFSEEQALSWLLKAMAQRFLLASKKETDNGLVYSIARPRTGLVFQARVRRKPDSRMFDLERFQWDKDKKEYDIFGDPIAYCDDESVEIAMGIIATREVSKLKREQSKAARDAQIKQDEEVPF